MFPQPAQPNTAARTQTIRIRAEELKLPADKRRQASRPLVFEAQSSLWRPQALAGKVGGPFSVGLAVLLQNVRRRRSWRRLSAVRPQCASHRANGAGASSARSRRPRISGRIAASVQIRAICGSRLGHPGPPPGFSVFTHSALTCNGTESNLKTPSIPTCRGSGLLIAHEKSCETCLPRRSATGATP